jgi:hypothetical protein
MAWTAPRTWVAGEVLTAALLNTHLRDNILETTPATVTTAGDVVVADAANSIKRIALGTGLQLLRVNAGATDVEWGSMPGHIPPERWGRDVGTKYFAVFNDADMLSTGAGLTGLTDAGWTNSGAAIAAQGAAGDFLASADVDPAGILDLVDAADFISSPQVFGDYAHARAVQEIIGAVPTTMILRVYARFETNSADEQGTYFGLSGDSAAANGDSQGITIHSDSANFRLRMGSTTTEDAGAAVDTAWHLWQIDVTANSVEWFIDGASQGTIAEDEDDQWPMCFQAAVATTNDLNIAWVEIEYQ